MIPDQSQLYEGVEVADGFVAELLPATARDPEPKRKIAFFKAMALYWLMPGRYGPHLAVASLWRALFAHALSCAIACCALAGLWLIQEREASLGPLFPAGVREYICEFVFDAAADSVSWRVGDLMGFLAIFATGVGIWPLALVLMPWCAGGDRASSVFWRSLKNVYWSTTIIVPFSVAMLVIGRMPFSWDGLHAEALLTEMAVEAVLLLLWLRALFVGARVYVGEADGPAFGPREPVCEECGYTLVHLRLDSNCPECGFAVRESLPGGRRKPIIWQQREMSAVGFLDLLRMQWVILRDEAFFSRLPVHDGLKPARHFWWTTYLLMVIVPLLCLQVIVLVAQMLVRFPYPPVLEVGLLLMVPLVLQIAVSSAMSFYAQLRGWIRDYRVAATVCCYGSVLMWPLVLTVVTFAFLFSFMFQFDLDDVELFNHGYVAIELWHVVLLLAVVSILLSLLFWRRRLVQSIKACRHANT